MRGLWLVGSMMLAAQAAGACDDGTEHVAADPGPPMTGAEADAFRLSVQYCWSVGSLSPDAQKTIVTVAFDLDREGRLVGDVTLLESAGGASEGAVASAFETARRAVVRCQGKGYPLPAEKYESWRSVVLTFDPIRGVVE